MKVISKELSSKAVLLAFLAGGLALLTIGIILTVRTFQFTNSSISTEGLVTEMIANSEGMQAPVIEYFSKDGTPFTFRSSVYSQPPAYRPGEKVELLYDPANPGHAEVKETLWFLPGLITGLGVFVLFLDAACYFFLARGKNFSLRKEMTFEKVL